MRYVGGKYTGPSIKEYSWQKVFWVHWDPKALRNHHHYHHCPSEIFRSKKHVPECQPQPSMDWRLHVKSVGLLTHFCGVPWVVQFWLSKKSASFNKALTGVPPTCPGFLNQPWVFFGRKQLILDPFYVIFQQQKSLTPTLPSSIRKITTLGT